MNSLQVNSDTGFLESPSPSNATFTSDKKINFIEAADKYRKEGKFPRVSDICDVVGIDARTFERHLELDDRFREAWKEVSTRIEYDCISDMSDLRKKNPMYMFGLLRYLNPQRWNPSSNQTNQVNNISIFVDNLKDIGTQKAIDISQ